MTLRGSMYNVYVQHFTITLEVTLHLHPFRNTDHAGVEPRYYSTEIGHSANTEQALILCDVTHYQSAGEMPFIYMKEFLQESHPDMMQTDFQLRGASS